ncbi:MAG: hypothetical protein Q9161_008514 [Pseudevernia consocians]
MAPLAPQETSENITQNLSSLNPLELLAAQQKHAQVWRMLFQDEKWLREAERHGLNPVLVGFDLQHYYKSEENCTSKTSGKPDEKHLVLQPGDMSGDFTTYSRKMSKLFFSCLRPHDLDEATKSIRLRNGPTIYVGAVFDDPEIIKLPDLTKLYSPERNNPESRYLFWRHANNALGRVGYDEMRGFGGKGRQRWRFASICCSILSESCVRTEHPPEYHFQREDFDDSVVRCIGNRGKNGWTHAHY